MLGVRRGLDCECLLHFYLCSNAEGSVEKDLVGELPSSSHHLLIVGHLLVNKIHRSGAHLLPSTCCFDSTWKPFKADPVLAELAYPARA